MNFQRSSATPQPILCMLCFTENNPVIIQQFLGLNRHEYLSYSKKNERQYEDTLYRKQSFILLLWKKKTNNVHIHRKLWQQRQQHNQYKLQTNIPTSVQFAKMQYYGYQ
jgi:hypothetical protein